MKYLFVVCEKFFLSIFFRRTRGATRESNFFLRRIDVVGFVFIIWDIDVDVFEVIVCEFIVVINFKFEFVDCYCFVNV